jgi:Fungal trichothecene efflux pump (TRI12)
MMTAGIGGLAAVDQNHRALGIGLSVLGGFGVGGIIIPAATILTIICPDDVIATATAITFSVRLIGGSIGYAIYFNVFENRFVSVFPTLVGTAVAEAGLQNRTDIAAFLQALGSNNRTAIAAVHGLTPQILEAAQEAVLDTYVAGFKRVYLVSIAFGGAAVLASLFLGNIKKYMVDRVAVDIH